MNKTEQIKPLFEVDDTGRVSLNFHPGQVKAWHSKKRFVFVLAGTQSGKTSFGPWWLWREIKECGGGDYLAVSPTYDLFKLKLLPEMLDVFVNTLHIAKYYPSERILELCDPKTGKFSAKLASDKMYARIILRSAEAGSKKGGAGVGSLESASANAAWLDEVGMDSFTLQAWEAVLRRLSLSEGRILGTTTIYNFGWMKSEIYDRWINGSSNIDLLQFESIMNPAFPRSEYNRAFETLQAWKFDMLYRGIYSKPAGMVYHDFDSVVHVVAPFEIPSDWKRYVGIDPGAIHTALLWLAEDKEHESYYIYRESLEGNMTTQEHTQKALLESDAKQAVKWVGGSKSEKQFRLDWKDAGIDVEEPSVTDVESGLDRVTALLKAKRLLVFSTCRGIIDEFGRYSRKLDAKGEVTEQIENKSEFHRLDALRYIISNLGESETKKPNVTTNYFIPDLDRYGTGRRF
jgi:hypothetical protein